MKQLDKKEIKAMLGELSPISKAIFTFVFFLVAEKANGNKIHKNE